MRMRCKEFESGARWDSWMETLGGQPGISHALWFGSRLSWAYAYAYDAQTNRAGERSSKGNSTGADDLLMAWELWIPFDIFSEAGNYNWQTPASSPVPFFLSCYRRREADNPSIYDWWMSRKRRAVPIFDQKRQKRAQQVEIALHLKWTGNLGGKGPQKAEKPRELHCSSYLMGKDFWAHATSTVNLWVNPCHCGVSPTGRQGTCGYMAPEVLMDLPYNEKVDIYRWAVAACFIKEIYAYADSQERRHVAIISNLCWTLHSLLTASQQPQQIHNRKITSCDASTFLYVVLHVSKPGLSRSFQISVPYFTEWCKPEDCFRHAFSYHQSERNDSCYQSWWLCSSQENDNSLISMTHDGTGTYPCTLIVSSKLIICQSTISLIQSCLVQHNLNASAVPWHFDK